MFAVGRQLRLSESALADLMLERVRELVPDVDELSFVEAAKSPGQARAYSSGLVFLAMTSPKSLFWENC